MAATGGAIALSGKPAVVYGEPEPPAIEKFVDEVGVLQAKQAERRLAVLDRRMRFWVKDSTLQEPDKDPLPTYTITITPETKVEEIRRMIARQNGVLRKEKPKVAVSGEPDYSLPEHLNLVFCGVKLDDGKTMDDYNYMQEKHKWSTPYAGVIWVTAFYLDPKWSSRGSQFKVTKGKPRSKTPKKRVGAARR